ncbi:hypothetical protein KZP23_21940 [Echinicola marina]|uniref:hypothetical protein n=1 Tax=Echinicola marina TaxID=2859768 RepID=UPI001CF71BEE|nr:hypothetical protein [Echinicola marina]UCS93275.1 hypothetical protein KZP23_21940 [Echinicola marina]
MIKPSISIPTDNLYKFFSIAGFFLVISATCVFYNYNNHLFNELYQLKEKEALLTFRDLQSPPLEEQSLLKEERIVLNNKIDRFGIKAKKYIDNLILYVVCMALFWAVTIFGTSKWYNWQVLQDIKFLNNLNS